MALTMTASSMMGAKVVAPQRNIVSRRAVAPVSASLRSDVARFAKAAGVGAASLAIALSAQAADVKLGLDNGGLVRAFTDLQMTRLVQPRQALLVVVRDSVRSPVSAKPMARHFWT